MGKERDQIMVGREDIYESAPGGTGTEMVDWG